MKLKQDHRREQADLAQQIQSRRTSQDVQTIMSLLDVSYTLAKDALVNATPENIFRLQGEAQAFEKLILLLSRPSAEQLATPRS